ncbi:uncharacterized protein LOC121250126 [Juglans microcarpa x Juglans regia]|uniref:uncharacterized protein LOC121250126 n=1 Tax=Juglans microcarpa x Juglans regia TaxID=2249226 RepID=UPI001B7E366C|nr:uncharacterized protein LOC121250126 [Juglans microcarpa x Juglans regia]
MVVPLGPGKFYGSSLPRPRIYTDVKYSDERVDPPVPVLDPFMSWANEAHWSMGGLSFKRLRLQGRIEGNVTKLRAEREKAMTNQDRKKFDSPNVSVPPVPKKAVTVSRSESPPPAPIATKRRRYMTLVDDDEEEEINVVKRRLVKKLGDDFDRVAMENTRIKVSPVKESGQDPVSGIVGMRTRSRGVEEGREQEHQSNSKGKGKKNSKGSSSSAGVSGVRTSPRLAKEKGGF